MYRSAARLWKVSKIYMKKTLTSIVGLVALGGDSGDCAAKLETSEVVRWFASDASEPSPKFVGRSRAPPCLYQLAGITQALYT